MVISYDLDGIVFTWDATKADANLAKHGVSFQAAAEAVLDPLVQVIEIQHEAAEERTVLVGMTQSWILLYVVSAIQRTSIRVISARDVTRIERKRYETR